MRSQKIGNKIIENSILQIILPTGGYFWLVWPTNATLKDLNTIRGMCNFQMDAAIAWELESGKDRATEWAEKLWGDWIKP